MKNILYILTTEKEIDTFESLVTAYDIYRIREPKREHMRLERVNVKFGLVRVLKSKNNIW